MAKSKIESLLEKQHKLESELEECKRLVEAEVESQPFGAIFKIGEIPYQISQAEGKKVLSCMMNARLRAMTLGLPVPAYVPRTRKAKNAGEAPAK